MKIAVLNGSPKGMTSVTMQYVQYMQQEFPQHDFKIICISNRIKLIEKKEAVWQEILETVRSSDAVIWAYPVYYLVVPGGYKRFIELIFEREVASVFEGKPAAILSTSIKYFDHTALYYMQAVCEDLGMRYLGAISPEMYELAEEKGQQTVRFFTANFLENIANHTYLPRDYRPVDRREFEYRPAEGLGRTTLGGKQVVIVTDSAKGPSNLNGMINRLKGAFEGTVRLVNISDLHIKGSCLGCLKCWYDHRCMFKDDFEEVLNKDILSADIMIWCGEIRDRFLSAKWKAFMDRLFCKGHDPWMVGKQVGMLVSGPLSQIPNVREIFEGFFETIKANFVGFVTDEYGDSQAIDRLIDHFAEQLVKCAEAEYTKPVTFLGYGASLQMREVFWGRFRFPFVADYRAYFKNAGKSFPTRDYKQRLKQTALTTLSTWSPSFRKKITKSLKRLLLVPNEKVLKKQ